VALGCLLLPVTAVEAGEWDITPRLSVAEVYSDNINHDDNKKESDLITEITPGLSVHGQGGRLKVDLDYQLQNTIFLDNSDANGSFHQLSADATAELAKNLFFVDASSSMGQAIIDADKAFSVDNLNAAGNRTDFVTYTLSPYILPHFGGYADASLRYTYSQVSYDQGASDGEQNRFNAGIVSGRKFGPLSWSANYDFADVQRDNSSDEQFENTDASARYRITDQFGLLGQAGYASNDFQSTQVIENGSYWALGAYLQPSRYYSIEATKGDRLETAALGLYPTRRTSLLINYRDREVGLNPGAVWSGSLQHRTRRTTWSANYLEDTTTEQQLRFVADTLFLGIDPLTGDVNTNPQPGDLVVELPIDPVFSITDEVIERKRASGSVGMKTGRSGLLFNVFDERRTRLTSLTEQQTRGGSGSWNWRFAPRTNSLLTASWQRLTDQDKTERDFWYLQAKLVRKILPRLNGLVEYRFTRQDDDVDTEDYDENRVMARITAYF
jgi:uncharacterized protein (PEP-CTERM system associated)